MSSSSLPDQPDEQALMALTVASDDSGALLHTEFTSGLPFIQRPGDDTTRVRLDNLLTELEAQDDPLEIDRQLQSIFHQTNQLSHLLSAGWLYMWDWITQKKLAERVLTVRQQLSSHPSTAIDDASVQAYLNHAFPTLSTKAKQHRSNVQRHDRAKRSLQRTGWATRAFIDHVLVPMTGGTSYFFERLTTHVRSRTVQNMPSPLCFIAGASTVMVARLAGLDDRLHLTQRAVIDGDTVKFLKLFDGDTYGPAGSFQWDLRGDGPARGDPAVLQQRQAQWDRWKSVV